MQLRSADYSDVAAIASLHANSWRLAYRGALSDAFLDAEADSDRLTMWEERLRSPPPNQHVFVLVDGAHLVGFASVYTNDHPEFGSFLNNLHVAESCLRRGCGTRLMTAVRRCCKAAAPQAPVYLWVLDSNQRAQAFYLRTGATQRGQKAWEPPGGGRAVLHRFAWDSPTEITAPG